MRQNVVADTTARAEEEKDRYRLISLTAASFAFLPSFHRRRLPPGNETSARSRRDFPRDHPALLRRVLDVLVRDGESKSTIFQRASAIHTADTYVFVRVRVYVHSVKSTFRAAP